MGFEGGYHGFVIDEYHLCHSFVILFHLLLKLTFDYTGLETPGEREKEQEKKKYILIYTTIFNTSMVHKLKDARCETSKY